MKKLALTILTAILGISSYAQDHMTFKGIEINGTPTQMAKNLEKVGFSLIESNDYKSTKMEGKFAGFDATINIIPNNEGQAYAILAVYKEDLETWSQLQNRFSFLENILIEKYGEPTHTTKDAENLALIYLDRGEWESIWITEKGNIMLFISASNHRSGTVGLGYSDKINNEVNINQAYQDL